MKTTVVRFKPARISYRDALELWASGEFSLCADHLAESRAPRFIFLRNRCLFRSGQVQEALNDLLELEIKDLLPEHGAQLAVMRSSAYFLTKQWKRGFAEQKVALALCGAISDVAMRCEMLFYRAISLFISNEFREFDGVVAEVEQMSDDPACGYDAESYPFSLGYWRGRVFDIAGVAAAVQGDCKNQTARFSAALEIFALSGVRDDYFEVSTLANLADAPRIFGQRNFEEFPISMLDKFKRSANLLPHLSRAYFNLAEHASVEGKRGESLRLLRLATEMAPTGALQLRGMLARVDLLEESGETLGSRDLLEQALIFNQSIDWRDPSNEPKICLVLYLASRIAPHSPMEATRLLNLYHSPRQRDFGNSGLTTDVAEAAEEQVALAQSAASLRNERRALEHFNSALEMYKKIGDQSKVATVSFEICKIDYDDHVFENAKQWALSYPLSPLANRVSNYRPIGESHDLVSNNTPKHVS